jgi:hypothetical protein
MDPRPRLAPPYGDEEPWPADRLAPRPGQRRTVLVELAGGPGMSPVAAAVVARSLAYAGFEVDEAADVVPVRSDGGENYVVTGTVADAEAERALEARPEVVKVWRDSPIAPF